MSFRSALAVVSVVSLCAVAAASAAPAGPQYPPPGGVTLGEAGDSGRPGGATWTYSGFDFSAFVEMWWGPIDVEPVKLAFDGAVDAPGEILTFDPAQSSPANGKAVWTGSAVVPLHGGGTETVQTRFTVTTKTPGGAPVVLIDPTGVGIPAGAGLVAPVEGDYRAEFLFEGKRASGPWLPALDLYDGMPTPAGAGNNARLSFSAGFYFEPVCGNGVREGDEECDDGDGVNGTADSCCDAGCLFEPSGTFCEDGDLCTQDGACDGGGTCVGSDPIVCAALDDCHVPGTCDPQTGTCDDPAAPNGTACEDGDACTIHDTCLDAVCEGGVSTLNEPLTNPEQTVACVVQTLPVP